MPNTFTVADLKTAVAGFMQRPQTTFVRTDMTPNLDLLLVACNNGRLYAERRIDFELAKLQAYIEGVSPLNGASLSTAKKMSDDSPVSLKKIITPYLSFNNGSGQYPIDLWTKKKWADRVKARFEGAKPTDTSEFAFITDSPFVLVQDGPNIFVAPGDTTALTDPFIVYLDAIAWLPNYTLGTQTDFIIQNCFDWMMFYCVDELNYYLKEDERVMLSKQQLEDKWNSVILWNDQLIASSVDDIDLD